MLVLAAPPVWAAAAWVTLGAALYNKVTKSAKGPLSRDLDHTVFSLKRDLLLTKHVKTPGNFACFGYFHCCYSPVQS